MSYNPFGGFNNNDYPGYNQAYDRCSCGQPTACGNEHQAAVQVQTVTRTSASGQKEQVQVVKPIGSFFPDLANRAFAVWDGALALNDLSPPKFKAYRPPAYPYVCDRPMAGSSLCSASGSCNP